MEQKLKRGVAELQLAEFKALYKTWKTSVPWLDHLLLGLLFYLERKLIDNRVKNEVNKVVEEVELPPMPDYVTPIITETPSKTSTRLPELRITSPWYIDKVGERSEPPEGI